MKKLDITDRQLLMIADALKKDKRLAQIDAYRYSNFMGTIRISDNRKYSNKQILEYYPLFKVVALLDGTETDVTASTRCKLFNMFLAACDRPYHLTEVSGDTKKFSIIDHDENVVIEGIDTMKQLSLDPYGIHYWTPEGHNIAYCIKQER